MFSLKKMKKLSVNLKNHIKEFIAYIVVFSIICFAAATHFSNETHSAESKWQLTYTHIYTVSLDTDENGKIFLPVANQNYKLHNVTYPGLETGAVTKWEFPCSLQYVGYMEDYRNIANLVYIENLIKKNTNITNTDKLMVFKLLSDYHDSTYGFIIGEVKDSLYYDKCLYLAAHDSNAKDDRYHAYLLFDVKDGNGNPATIGSSDITIYFRDNILSFMKCEPRYTIKGNELTYNGEKQALTESIYTPDFVVYYSVDNLNTWSDSIPRVINAGRYLVYYKTKETRYYLNTIGSVEVEIKKANQKVTAPTMISNINPDTDSDKPILTIKPEVTFGNTDASAIKYSLDNKTWQSEVPKVSDLKTLAGEEPAAKTEAIIYYKIEGNNNFLEYSNSISSDINKKAQTVTAPTIDNGVIYNGQEQKIFKTLPKVEEGKGNIDGTVFYSVYDLTEEKEISTEIADEPMLTNAGEYRITYKIDGNNLYNAYESSVFVSIHKAKQEITAPIGTENLIYDGEFHDLISEAAKLIKGNSDAGAKILYKINENSSWDEKPQGKNAGTYKVYYISHENRNYEEYKNYIEVKINMAEQTVEAPLGSDGLIYNGKSQELFSSGAKVTKGNESGVRYRVNGGEWIDKIPSATDAGEYKIEYKVLGSENYREYTPKSDDSDEKSAENNYIKVIISKASQNVSQAKPRSNMVYKEYEQELLEKTPVISEGNTSAAVKYHVVTESENAEWKDENANWNISLPKAIDAGKYVIHYKVDGNLNYSEFLDSVSVEIEKSKQEVNSPKVAEGLEYNGGEQAIITAAPSVISGNKEAEIQYSINDNSENAKWSSEIPKVSEPGKYVIYYKVSGNNNYEELIGSIEAKVKAIQEITPPETASNLSYNGKAQALLSSEAIVKNGNNDAKTEYSLDKTEWSTNIPSATKPGDYVVYYRIEGNDSYVPFENSVSVSISDPRNSWGIKIEINGITHYVDSNGKTSVEITGNDVIWLKEESYMSYAWYGLDNSLGTFENSSRFWVKWLNKEKDPDEWNSYYQKIDNAHKKLIENNRLWIFLTGVTAPDGTEYTNFNSEVSFFVQLGSDWDEDDINAIFIADENDEKVKVSSIAYANCPAGNEKFAKLILKHFSPYGVYDAIKSNEDSDKKPSENLEDSKNNNNSSESKADSKDSESENNEQKENVSNGDFSNKKVSEQVSKKEDYPTKDSSFMCLSYCVSILSFMGAYKPKF